MNIQLIFLELALGVMLIGGIAAFKRSIGERICLLISVPLSYLIAFLLAKVGVFDGIGGAVMGLLSGIGGLSEILSASAAAQSGIAAFVACIIRPILAVVVFWLLVLITRIVITIVVRKSKLGNKFALFAPATPGKAWKNVVACALGVVSCFIFAMLSYLPIAALENVAKPAVEKATTAEYEGTYVNHIATVVDDNFLPTGSKSVYGGMQKYTGLSAILSASVNSLSTTTITNNSGKKIVLNSTKTVQNLLCDGVDAMIMYEYFCHPDDYTLGNLSAASGIVNDIADAEPILTILVEIFGNTLGSTEGGEGEENTATDLISELVLNKYLGEDVAALQNDLHAVAGLIDVITEDLGDVKLDTDELTEALLEYLSKKECVVKVVNQLSEMKIYEGVFDFFVDYGVDLLCQMLEISPDKEGHFEAFTEALYAAANKRDEGSFDIAEVDKFIAYAQSGDVNVSEYAVEDEENLTEIDFAYLNYENFMEKMLAFEDVFVGYGLDSGKKLTAYVAADGTVYCYDSIGAKWTILANEANYKKTSYASQLLAVKTAAILEGDMNYTITKEEIAGYCNQILSELSTLGTSTEIKNNTEWALKAYLSVTDFEAEGVIFATDVKGALKKGIGFDESQNENFAQIIESVFVFLDTVQGEQTIGIDVIMNNFHLVGRLLDNLYRMDKTSDIPAMMLKAITQNQEFGKYFLADSIDDLTNNVANGFSTYEELFASVQALYNIVNQIIPT